LQKNLHQDPVKMSGLRAPFFVMNPSTCRTSVLTHHNFFDLISAIINHHQLSLSITQRTSDRLNYFCGVLLETAVPLLLPCHASFCDAFDGRYGNGIK
jgi:hypothetical protein